MVSDSTALAGGLRASARSTPDAAARAQFPDARRWLQLGLAAIWLLDGILQFQSFMFTNGFSQMLAGTAPGNPAVIADPINWTSRLITDHPVATNTTFAAIQVLLGLGIGNRRTVKVALAASIAWALGVWWFGEGLGGILSGSASPVNGAPGAVIIYALLAVLLWPVAGDQDDAHPAPFVAARPVGPALAKAAWLILWGSLAYFAVTAANRTAQGLHDMVAGMASGEPGWLAAVNRAAASLLNNHGLTASIILAVLLAVIAVGVFLPVSLARATIILAIVLALAIWIAGQDLGTILAGGATDPNSGLLLALLAAAYWPAARRPALTPETQGELE
ncbi:MAG TPA: hypothetical protein VMB74_05245 [Streptosporangiaceae bacterium]|nr:hypothetical protein [Streptosporangiaceae bacterium]